MKRTAIGVAGALVIHVALAIFLTRVPRFVSARSRIVEIDVRKIPPKLPPPPPTVEKIVPPPPPPEPVKPPPKRVKKPEVAQAPIPNETRPPPKEPPKEPPKPVFGLSASSTTGNGSVSMPVGNTTVADPSTARPGPPPAPLAPAPPGVAPGPVFRPATEAEIDKEPEFEEGSCDAVYPDGEAKQNGVQGETILRVEIDERGRVHGVKVLKGVGHGLDDLAVRLMKSKCRYSPARDKKGKPVPFAITHYVTWKLD